MIYNSPMEFKSPLTNGIKEKIEKDLYLSGIVGSLAAGKAIQIEVQDYDLGRALIDKESSILKRKIDDYIQTLDNKLNASACKLVVLDFTGGGKPEQIIKDFFKQHPKMRDPRLINYGGKRFNDFYPGQVAVLFGVDNISKESNVFDMRNIAKHAPTVFVHKKISNANSLNRHVFSSIGDYGTGEKALIAW